MPPLVKLKLLQEKESIQKGVERWQKKAVWAQEKANSLKNHRIRINIIEHFLIVSALRNGLTHLNLQPTMAPQFAAGEKMTDGRTEVGPRKSSPIADAGGTLF